MIIKSFIFSGVVCLIAQIIKDNTHLTSGHITSIFVSLGSLLGFFGIYDHLVKMFGGGASVVIMSFGNTLYKTAIEKGVLNMLCGVSVGIVSSILIAFFITLVFKVKD